MVLQRYCCFSHVHHPTSHGLHLYDHSHHNHPYHEHEHKNKHERNIPPVPTHCLSNYPSPCYVYMSVFCFQPNPCPSPAAHVLLRIHLALTSSCLISPHVTAPYRRASHLCSSYQPRSSAWHCGRTHRSKCTSHPLPPFCRRCQHFIKIFTTILLPSQGVVASLPTPNTSGNVPMLHSAVVSLFQRVEDISCLRDCR